MSLVRDFISWWMAPTETPINLRRAITAWEVRRIPFNVALLVLFQGCFLIYRQYVESYPPATQAGDDSSALVPLAASLFLVLLVANVVYSAGWLVEFWVSRSAAPRPFSRPLFTGLLLVAALVALPIVCSMNYRETFRSNLSQSP